MDGGAAGPSVVNSSNEEDDDMAAIELPPGFRFHPTDEEVIMHYLLNKVMDRRFGASAIGEADLNKCEPWDLPKKAKMGEKEWYFFCQRDRKYPTGMRTNRATESGYWKATGKDKEIYKSRNCLVGMKKTLVFYKGRAPKGEKTNWVMHEFRLEGNFSNYNFSRASKEEWVVSKIFHKNSGIRRSPGIELARIDSFVDHLLDSSPTLPPLTDYSNEIRATFATEEQQFKPNNSTPSRIFAMNNHYLQMQNDQKPFFVPPQNYTFNTNNPFSSQIALPNSISPHQGSSSLGYNHHQDGLSSMIAGPGYPMNFPFKGSDQANLRLMAPKMEHFSTNNSMMSQSQDTGLSTDQMALANNEISSVHSKDDVESKKPYDQELEGIPFSPNISDLDSLWSY